MKTNRMSSIARVSMCVVVVGGSLFAASPSIAPCAPGSVAQDWNYPAEASGLLKEIQSTAFRLTRDAATLQSYAGGRLSSDSHARQLNLAKSHINTIGDKLERLQEIRHVAAPWQQQAIDTMVPVAVDLAGRTQAAILHVNDRPGHLWVPAYTSHLRAIADHADRLKDSVDLHLELASTQDKLEELRFKTASIGS